MPSNVEVYILLVIASGHFVPLSLSDGLLFLFVAGISLFPVNM